MVAIKIECKKLCATVQMLQRRRHRKDIYAYICRSDFESEFKLIFVQSSRRSTAQNLLIVACSIGNWEVNDLPVSVAERRFKNHRGVTIEACQGTETGVGPKRYRNISRP